MLRCGTFEKPDCWNSYPFAGIATGSLFSNSAQGTIDDRYCPDAASAVPYLDVPGRARDPRVRRIPRRAAAAEPRAPRRWASGAGVPGPRGLRRVDARAALLSDQQGLRGKRLAPGPQLRPARG